MHKPDRSRSASPSPRCWVAPAAPHDVQAPRIERPTGGWSILTVLIIGDTHEQPDSLSGGWLSIDADQALGEVSRPGIHTWLQLYAGTTWLRIHDYAIIAKGIMLFDWSDPDSHAFWFSLPGHVTPGPLYIGGLVGPEYLPYRLGERRH